MLIALMLVAAASEPKAGAPVPAALAAKLQASIDVGRELYLQDRAASIATDVLVAGLGGLDGHDIGGYVGARYSDLGSKEAAGVQVVFFTASQPTMLKYLVRVPKGRGVKSSFEELAPPRRPDEQMLRLIHARAAAIRAAGPFQQSINPVVMPAGPLGKDGQILVELLAGSQKAGVVVLGKHFRVLVSADGTRVDSVQPLTKAILELPTKGEQGEKIEALSMIQLEPDYPLEIHVFASLSAKLPLYLLTPDGAFWMIDGDKISLLVPPKPKQSP